MSIALSVLFDALIVEHPHFRADISKIQRLVLDAT
jgi:hypothetical protein